MSEHICPVCGKPLEPDCLHKTIFLCVNPCCRMLHRRLDPWFYNLLMDGKKAQDALGEIKSILESARYADTLNFNLDNADGRHIYEIITSVEKK